MKILLAIACVLMIASSAEAQTRKRTATSKASTSESQEEPSKASETDAAGKAKSKNLETTVAGKATSKAASLKSRVSKTGSSQSKPKSDSSKAGSAEKVASALKRSTAIPPDKKKPSQAVAVDPKEEIQSPSAKTATSKKPDTKPRYDAGDELPSMSAGQFGPNITLDPEDLADFEKQPAAVQRLLRLALELTNFDLTYRYGSAEPSSGGMDCSGTIYYLLKSAGIKEPPRDSTGLYLWAEREGTLHRVSPLTLKDSVMDDLRPGDLLFWEGTYNVLRNPPISHTMIYLGREKKTGFPVMVGASDGRTYAGVRRNGVSVFDFKLPRTGSSARFVGYARVPGLDRK